MRKGIFEVTLVALIWQLFATVVSGEEQADLELAKNVSIAMPPIYFIITRKVVPRISAVSILKRMASLQQDYRRQADQLYEPILDLLRQRLQPRRLQKHPRTDVQCERHR
jgi:hypothetical protein